MSLVFRPSLLGPRYYRFFFPCSRVIMCCQKVNQNWKKSKLLPSPVGSRSSRPHTVTPWSPRPAASSSPRSTSSRPPPTGAGAAKSTSVNHSCLFSWSYSQRAGPVFFSFTSLKLLTLRPLFKICYSLKRLETAVLTPTQPAGWALPRSSLPNGLLSPRVSATGWKSFRGR